MNIMVPHVSLHFPRPPSPTALRGEFRPPFPFTTLIDAPWCGARPHSLLSAWPRSAAYRDAAGNPWVLPVVKTAERLLLQQLEAGEINHEYDDFNIICLRFSPLVFANAAITVQSPCRSVSSSFRRSIFRVDRCALPGGAATKLGRQVPADRWPQ